jgi:hypothetical protein
VYCKPCDPSHRFSNWGAAKTGAIIFFSTFLLIVFIFWLFFLPLCPRVEELIARAVNPAAQRLEEMLGTMVQAAARLSGTGRPRSAAIRPQSAAAPDGDGKEVARSPRAGGSLAARTRAIQRRTSYSTTFTTPTLDGDDASAATHVRVRVQRPTRVAVLLELVSKPLRIIISFWQCVHPTSFSRARMPHVRSRGPNSSQRNGFFACRVVSSFSSNLYVPWPSIYCAYNLALVALRRRLRG